MTHKMKIPNESGQKAVRFLKGMKVCCVHIAHSNAIIPLLRARKECMGQAFHKVGSDHAYPFD